MYLTLNGEEYDYANLMLVGEGMSTGLNNDGEKVFFIEATPGEVNSEIYAAVKPIDIMSEDAFLRINEVMLDNENCLVDNDGDHSAWAELYNSSSQTVKLNRYFLSDDANDMLKWRLPDIELEGGAYTIIYLSGKDKEMHTSFRVSDGEPVILTDFSQFEQQTVMFADESRLTNIS